MTEGARAAAEAIDRTVADGTAPAGSLRVFGDWFGRPMDNVHRVVSAGSAGQCLTVRFDGGEVLRVWDPDVVELLPRLRIGRATRVRWEWFSYGRDRTPENLQVREHRLVDGAVVLSGSAPGRATSQASPLEPAVELA